MLKSLATGAQRNGGIQFSSSEGTPVQRKMLLGGNTGGSKTDRRSKPQKTTTTKDNGETARNH